MATASTSSAPGTSYVEWGVIIAGTILACAISLILIQFGNALGLSAVDTLKEEGSNVRWRVIAVGIWLLWVQLMASMAGGYLAGRMRAPVANIASHEGEIRDGAHGLLVWALSTLIAVSAAAVAGFLAAWAAHAGVDVAQTAAAKVPDVSAEFKRHGAIIFNFGMVATSIVSAIAAWWMATVGGDHRDRGADASRYFSFRRQ